MDEVTRRRESDEEFRRREVMRVVDVLNLTYCDVSGHVDISDGHEDHYYNLGIKFTPQFWRVVKEVLRERALDRAEYEGEMSHQMSVLSGQASGRTL